MTTDFPTHDWLPGPLSANTIPLSIEELEQLYASNVVLTEEDVSELSQQLPYLSDVLTPGQFRSFVLKKRIALQAGVSGRGIPDEDTGAASTPTVDAVADLCGSSSAKVVTKLRKAVCALLPEAYEAAYARLADLSRKRGAYRRRRNLIARLAQAAPNWAAAITARNGVHAGGHIPGDAIAAWHWRQAQQDKFKRGF